MIAPEQEQSMANKIGAKTTTVSSSHAVMLSHATEVARVATSVRRLVATLAVAAFVAWTISAHATPSARLVYSRAHGAESCPDEGALRRAVAARVGYDPFFGWAKKTIVARMAPISPRGFVASVNLIDEQDDARRALAQNDGASALTWTDMHMRRFARHQLAEEREAIAIQALVLDGRYSEARARAARFVAASPNSLFLPAVDASLSSIP